MSGLEVLTFGCRLNALESEAIRARAREAGLAEAVIVNSCAVTAEAERQARQAIRRARLARPAVPIIVTGCAAQIAPERYGAMPEVDRVLGNAEKLRTESYRDGAGAGRLAVNDIASVRETARHLVASFDGRTRAFLEVQNGCDHRCTFCIIPFGRGPSRSVPPHEIVERARRLREAGFSEIVLTGVDLTAYGLDLPEPCRLGDLVSAILAGVPELERLRLSSLDAVEIDPALEEAIAGEPRLQPHLHLSLQAGSDLILKRMKRRHRREEALDLVQRLRARRPEIAFGADLIAGFPTETEAMAEESADLIAEARLMFVHVFPFSARPGTPAARMPGLPRETVKARARALRARAAAVQAAEFAARLGSLTEVLVEEEGRGRAAFHAPVRIKAPASAGRILRVRLEGLADDGFLGTPA